MYTFNSFYCTDRAKLVSAWRNGKINQQLLYRNASHHSFKQAEHSSVCLAFAPHDSFSQSLKRSYSSFFKRRNCPSTIYALSKPKSCNLAPSTSPIPASAVTDFSPMGSETKSLCFCDDWDISPEFGWLPLTSRVSQDQCVVLAWFRLPQCWNKCWPSGPLSPWINSH